MKRRKRSKVVVIIIAVLLIAVMMMDTFLVFRMTSRQTRQSGNYQLKSISGELESTINEAKNLTMQLAIQVQPYLEDKETLRKYVYAKKEELAEGENGCYNFFLAGEGWDIIPDLIKPEGFVGTERNWYVGAVKNAGSVYITPPYVDALTGNICYTVSIMLEDKDTVLGIDYTMENIQAHIREMYGKGMSNAVIVTEDGIVAGCLDEELIGEKLIQALPDYAGIFSLAKSQDGVVASRIKADVFYENLFATKSGNGWVLIVSEGDWELYKSSYIQLIITMILSLALFGIILVLYLLASHSQKKAELALASKEEFLQEITGKLREPLNRILDRSRMENVKNTEDYEAEFEGIHAAGEKLSEMIGQIISYSSIIKTEKRKKEKAPKNVKVRMNTKFRTLILVFMIVVMVVSLYINISVTYRWGNVLMQNEVNHYEDQLSEWINTQKSILDMFCSVISTNPDMLEDYEGTVEYLNRITKQFPEISVSYMTNPKLKHTVYMNNGWEPDDDWHVEERQWYIDTLAAKDGWSISAPYYDEQTGIYCVTISEQVYDEKSGEFLGNFGIDFYMDKLVEILGNSYSDTGYAFLVDADGDIINHPYGTYQMSLDKTTNISSLPYGELKADGKTTTMISDYDNTKKILIATRNEASNFKIYVVSNVGKIYGRVLFYGSLCLIAFVVCIILVYRLLTNLIHWQDKTNQQMKEAADSAIAAGNAKSQFLAQMSHEIRTPINAVLGMNEMILREAQDENIIDYASNIQIAGRTLLSIINSILDFSKIEDGKMEIIPVKYDTASMIHNLVNSISERAKSKGLEFVVQIDETLPSVLFGDDVRISQVIMNLLTNAVKYTEHGKVTLSVQSVSREGEQIEIVTEVRDTGIGIREEDMEKLFESFERLEEKRNRNIEGTGLGMSIVTKLLLMMDSELQVESVYGEGSVFSFRLQQKIIDGQPIGKYMDRLASSNRQKETERILKVSGDAKILIVDDNSMNLKVAKNLMKLCGILPDLASSGYEAIDKIKKKQYHIIFLDHMMPKMDGIETLNRLKEESLLEEGVITIALTANAVVGAKERYLEAGFDDYLSKPIEVQELEKKLVRYLPEDMISYHTKGGIEEANGDGIEAASEESGSEEEEILEFAPEESGAAEEEILEFAPEESGAAEEEILEFAPEESGSAEEEILEFAPEENGTAKAGSKENLFRELEAAGISYKDGLQYCGEDVSFYQEILQDYLGEFEEKDRELRKYFKEENWKEYQIYVHALKSTSKSVGANKIFRLAKDMEEAAKNEDALFLKEHQEELLSMYRHAAENLTQILERDGK